MITVSDIRTAAPKEYKNELQKRVYETLAALEIPFERVDTDEVITMEDCLAVNEKLNMKMVKTLFLCNRRQTEFYLFITVGDKPFKSKDFSAALDVARVSFAPSELMESMLGTKIGAATVFSALLDTARDVSFVFDKDIFSETYYGCSDGTTTGYMKIKMSDITDKFVPFCRRDFQTVEV